MPDIEAEPPDWSDWHRGYDQANSAQARRLVIIQRFINRWLDDRPPSPVKILSLCAGDGRDVIEVLASREDRARALVTLVERDTNNVNRARLQAERLGLGNVRIVQGDAGWTRSFMDAVPADLIIIAGVFGHLSDDDIRGTIMVLPGMCNPNATVLWTRRRRPFGILKDVARWFEEAHFSALPSFSREKTNTYIGAHRYIGEARPFNAAQKLFTFIYDEG